ncbi:MAG: signal peptide peptidase SppA [Flavobacteriaceae bacterium]
MNFFKNFLASVLGTLTAIGLFFALILMLVATVASVMVSPTSSKAIQANSVLDLNLNVPITDRNPSFDELEIILDLNEDVLGLPEIISAIDQAALNPKIEGIRLRSDFITAGWSQTRSIRTALEKFKAEGKFIYAYADFFTQKGYYLASVADSIILNPMGELDFKGLASEVLYYKDFQEEYGVKMEVIRLGKYKSAVEPYLDNKMSDANRYQIQTLLLDVWETLNEEISVGRKLSSETLDELINTQQLATPQDALDQGLIDLLDYESAVVDLIQSRLNLGTEEVRFASIADLNPSSPSAYDNQVKDRIAVVYANGPILYGEGTQNIIAQGVFTETLEELAKDDWVKAVVLRVDSPGGSALTSELLWQTLEKVKKQKPFLVSMGDVAASGGYYIAAGADQIFADPLSITGSIGVFASLPNASGFIENLGIHAETVETHPNALGYSIFQPLSPAFEAKTKKSIEKTYALFKQRVAEGRKLSETAVEDLAQGRVWSGKQALANGLIDSLGGLQATIQAAAKLAQIDHYNVMEYPNFEEDLSSLLSGLTISLGLNRLWNSVVPSTLSSQIDQLSTPKPAAQMQLLLPFEIKIH